jgi:hypothetical protein
MSNTKVTASNFRHKQDTYTFDLTVDNRTVRDIYYNVVSGEYGFPVQKERFQMTEQMASIYYEAMMALLAYFETRPSIETVTHTDILVPSMEGAA